MFCCSELCSALLCTGFHISHCRVSLIPISQAVWLLSRGAFFPFYIYCWIIVEVSQENRPLMNVYHFHNTQHYIPGQLFHYSTSVLGESWWKHSIFSFLSQPLEVCFTNIHTGLSSNSVNIFSSSSSRVYSRILLTLKWDLIWFKRSNIAWIKS